MSASAGVLSNWWVEPGTAAYTWDASSERYAFVSEDVQASKSTLHTEGITGTRVRHYTASRAGIITVGGTVITEPTYAMLNLFLPRMLGAAEVADVFDLADTLPEFGMLFDKGGSTFEYQDCKVGSWEMAAQDGFVRLTLNILGKVEAAGVAAPVGTSIAVDTTALVPVAYDAAITIGGGARKVSEWSLSCDNNVVPIFYNTQTAECLLENDREIRFRAVTNYTSTEHSALYAQSWQGATASIVFSVPTTHTGMSSTITLRRFQIEEQTPVVQGRQEIVLTNEGRVTGDGTDPEITWTHDPVV